MSKIAIAKPIEWQYREGKDRGNHVWREWTESRYGFYIDCRPREEPGTPYQASWGENDAESFATLEEAKEWCQDTINDWVGEHVLVIDAPVESEGKQS